MLTPRAETLAYPNAPVVVRRRLLPDVASREVKLTLLLALIHLPLGLVLYQVPYAGAAHQAATMLVGMYCALSRRYSLDRVAICVAYLISAEIIWRMARVAVFWEGGKYAAAAIMITALLVRSQYKIPKLPLIYFLALVPGCMVTLAYLEPSDARGLLSAVMSGPLALVAACWFFSHVRLDIPQVRRMLYAIIIPLLSAACATLFYTVTTENIRFTTESNFETSGGFGPNQVSSMLGLGVLMAAGSVVLFRAKTSTKVVLGAIAVFFAAQSVMTFSRSGIYNAIGALVVMVLFHFRNIADGVKRLVPILVFISLFWWFVFPTLNSFTGGRLLERFEETQTSNRTEIILGELALFLNNPVFGTGLGLGDPTLNEGDRTTAHTEFSRLLADHGSFGLLAVLCLFGVTSINLLRQGSTFGKALVAGVSVWSILYMSNAAMRLAAPSFLIGMTFITIVGRRPARRSQRLR